MEPPSSAEVVMSNKDLLNPILLRSSAILIFLWKSVSKSWLSLITNPTFALRRSQIPNHDHPFGLLFLRRITKKSFEYDFVPLDIRIPASRSPSKINFTLGSAAGKVEILQSCNGLLLCYNKSAPDPDKRIYVCNPFLNLFTMFKRPKVYCYSNERCIGGIKMAFDPTKSPHYKVIRAAFIENFNIVQIQTYSLETCEWSDCGVPFHVEYFSGFADGISWNEDICWLCWPNRVTHLKLNLQCPVVRSIKNPPEPGDIQFDDKLFESRGCLLLVRTTYSRSLNVYEMKNEYSEWLLKYLVNLDDFFVNISTKLLLRCVRSIVLGETEDESFLLMEINGMIFKYNIMLGSLSDFFSLGSSVSVAGIPLTASFVGVSFYFMYQV